MTRFACDTCSGEEFALYADDDGEMRKFECWSCGNTWTLGNDDE